jgi:flagellar biosynthesis protein FlhF
LLLDTFTGPAVERLLDEARAAFGSDTFILQTRAVAGAGGRPLHELLAGDADGVACARARCREPGWSRDLALPSPSLPANRTGKHRPFVLALIGPTGSGKTTTLAKLASHPEAFGFRTVGFLSLDSYRVGADAQLRTYAELCGVPCGVAYDIGDLAGLWTKVVDRDVVLIDTPGRSPGDRTDADAVREALAWLAPDEIHLVLPAGLHPGLAGRWLREYKEWGVTHLLASKLDEMPQDASVFDLAAGRGLPMRWLTDGQEVPDAIRPAAPHLLAALAASCVTDPAERVA